MRELVIAVDGPASSGKGTVARGVARALGFQYVDTGAMYRTVAVRAAQAGVDGSDAQGVAGVARGLRMSFTWSGDTLRVIEAGEDLTDAIRTGDAGRGASDVSRHPPVRAALLGLQRSLGEAGGVVMDGRDIGTVVLPDADLKVYLDAALEERARRRHVELVARGEDTTLEQIAAAIARRDRQDMEREVAPLRQADDAVVVDTTDLTIDQAIEAVLDLVRRLDSPSDPS